MLGNPDLIPRKPRRRPLSRLATALARLVLVAAGVCLLFSLILLVAWWRLISWPQRHASPRERSVAQREALLELVQAAGTLLATRKPAA